MTWYSHVEITKQRPADDSGLASALDQMGDRKGLYKAALRAYQESKACCENDEVAVKTCDHSFGQQVTTNLLLLNIFSVDITFGVKVQWLPSTPTRSQILIWPFVTPQDRVHKELTPVILFKSRPLPELFFRMYPGVFSLVVDTPHVWYKECGLFALEEYHHGLFPPFGFQVVTP